MAKIPNLFPHVGKTETTWHWKPSRARRAKGWKNQALGSGPLPARKGAQPIPPDPVANRALEINRQLEQWDLGCAQAAGGDSAPRIAAPPRNLRFADLVDAYRASEAYRIEIKASTRKNYDTRIRQLSFWAQDGELEVRRIDGDMVRDLKKGLLSNGGSKFKCAGMLRVLRLLLRWAVEERLLKDDATLGVAIPTPPSRRQLMTWRDVRDAAQVPGATEIGARALRIGFWSMQRREDLRLFNRFAWRELHGADPRDLPALVNARGEVWGFRIQPEKTRTTSGVWVDCPMPPFLHAEINSAFEHSAWLFPHPLDSAKPIEADLLRRRVKPLLIEFDLAPIEQDALDEVIAPLLGQVGRDPGNPAELRRAVLEFLCEDLRYFKNGAALLEVRGQLLAALRSVGYAAHQLRDMRRSGMSWTKDMGAEKADIFAISGHPLDGQQRTIADTYIVGGTKAACRAVAAACRTLATIEAREREQADG